MTESIPLSGTTAPDATPAPEPAPPTVLSITKEELSALLAQAVAAGQAQASGVLPLGSPPIQAEVPEIWSVNRLMRELIHKVTWFDERSERSAYATADVHFPLPADGE